MKTHQILGGKDIYKEAYGENYKKNKKFWNNRNNSICYIYCNNNDNSNKS